MPNSENRFTEMGLLRYPSLKTFINRDGHSKRPSLKIDLQMWAS